MYVWVCGGMSVCVCVLWMHTYAANAVQCQEQYNECTS